ncbi:MAG: heavy-metal-associated domain-containing protein [Cyanobacteria bacterium P01_F01_bin.150]
MATLELKVTDMACSACVETITKAVQAIDADAAIDANTQTKQVTIKTKAADTVVRNAIAAAGYTIAA